MILSISQAMFVYIGVTCRGSLEQIAVRVHTSELRGVTSHIGSHNVTCHPTQVNAPRLTPARKATRTERWKA